MSFIAAAAISLGVKAAIGGIKALAGRSKAKRAMKKLKNYKFAKYSRPGEYDQLLSLYQKRARAGMPGQDLMRDQMGAQAGASLAASQRAAPSTSALLAAQTDVYGRQMTEERNLGIQSAQYRAAREAELGGVYQQGAEYSDREFQINKYDPNMFRANLPGTEYQMAKQQASQGFNMFGSALGQGAGMFGQMAALNTMYPQPGTSIPPPGSTTATRGWQLQQPGQVQVGTPSILQGPLTTG